MIRWKFVAFYNAANFRLVWGDAIVSNEKFYVKLIGVFTAK